MNVYRELEALVKTEFDKLNGVYTAETMAKAVYAALQISAKAAGMNPDIEVSIWKPGKPRHHHDIHCWSVAWEAGPYQWAIEMSMYIGYLTNQLVEPYYSFDLDFDPKEID